MAEFDDEDPSCEIDFKIAVTGPCGAGKTSMMFRWADDTFHEGLTSTIGVDFKVKHFTRGDVNVKLMFWDMAGQERFRSITATYYRNVHIVLIVMNASNVSPMPVDLATTWLEIADKHATVAEFIPFLVLNKVDDISTTEEVASAITRHDVNETVLSRCYDKTVFEVSAKTGQGMSNLMAKILDAIAQTQKFKDAQTGVYTDLIRKSSVVNLAPVSVPRRRGPKSQQARVAAQTYVYGDKPCVC